MPTIAAAPFPYEFPAHGLARIVIDMQRDADRKFSATRQCWSKGSEETITS